ncbi:MAG: MBG domain-containing protein, partial [Cyclobacteriaceae bacterium]
MKTFHAKDLKHKRLKRNLRLLEVLIFTIILLIARPSHAQYDWRQISPLPTGNTINDVVFTSTNNAIAVGNSGTVLQSDDGGINWLTFNSPTIFSNDNILHVDFADANNGYILLRGGDQVMKTNSGGEGSWTVANGNGVGISGPNATTEGKELQVLNATTVVAINSVRAHITSNSGDFWTDITPSGLGVSPNFRDIYFVDPNLGYILSRQNGLFKTTNGGTSWTQLTAFTGIEASIVYFENEMNGWVVEGTGSSLTNTIHRTTDGGATWNSQTYPGGNQTARELIFTSSTDGKLFDGNKIYTSDDAGISWTLEDSFPFSPSSISYNSMDASFLLGGSDGNLGIYDNGTFVSLSNSLTKTANIADIHFNDLNNGFVVDSKDVHRTSDGGISWFSLGLSDMVDVEFATTSIGFLISSSKSVQKTTNGGITWSEVSVLNAGSYFPQSSDFLDVNTGWVVGTNSSVFKTVDGGTSWSAQTLPTPALTLYDVFFIDSNNGYISGSGGNVFKTTDGGTNWTNVGFAGSNGVWEMFWADASTGWLATTRVWKTTDGGASWSADNFPGHGTARDIQFLDANTGFATYDGGVIYQTADAGDSWTIFLDGGEVTLSLNDFYAIDIDNMWASGTRTLYNRAFQDATPPTSIGLFVPALDFCPGEEFIATFTADRQIPDETLTVQLSDVFGSFSSPTNIGILGEASTFSGNVVATIPMSVTPGSNYRMRAVIPSLTGSDNGADLSVGGPPDPTSFITSTDQVCKGQSGVPYSIAPVEGMSYLWTYSGSGSLTINGQGTPSVTINYFNSTTSGTLSVVLSNGCGSSSPLELPILVGTPNAGGAAAGGTTVCSGTASPELSVSGHIGQIVRWEQSVTPFSAYTPISSSNSETFTPPGVISETTRFRAVVQDAGCGEAMSSFTIVNVAQPTVGGTVDVLSGNTAIISGTSPGNLSLSGQLGSVLRWEKSVAPFASYTPISHTSTLYNPGALTEDTRFRAVVKNSLCTEEPSGFVEITILDSNPPMIQSLSPSDNAVEVALSANLVITFDEIVQKGTGTINIKRASDDFVLQTYSVNATNTTIAGKIVTINPPVNFPIGIEIYVEVPSTALQDLAGNDFGGIAGDGTWSFNTIRQNQTITFPDPADKTFGDTNFSLSASASSGLPITYSSSDPSVATVSGNTVTIVGAGSTTFTASQAGNSSFNSALDAVQDLNVSKASLSATADNKSKSYGEENPVLTFQYAGFVNSETAAVLDTPPTVSATTTAASDVGVYTILVSGGADNNYDFIYNGGTLSVNKATLTVSADNQNKLYGEENPELTSMFSGFVNGDIVSDLDVLPTVTTPATTTSNVGNYVIAVNGGSDNNYMYAYNGALLSISKAILTVTADNKIITFGDALPTFTLSYSGFANGDNDAHIDVLPSISTTASVGANAGQYDIDLTGGSDNNYSLTLVDGLLTIEKADQTITINS